MVVATSLCPSSFFHLEIDVLYTHAYRLHDPQPAALMQLRHQFAFALQPHRHPAYILRGQDHWGIDAVDPIDVTSLGMNRVLMQPHRLSLEDETDEVCKSLGKRSP